MASVLNVSGSNQTLRKQFFYEWLDLVVIVQLESDSVDSRLTFGVRSNFLMVLMTNMFGHIRLAYLFWLVLDRRG